MAKVTQGDAGKQKISLAPVKALSNIPAVPDVIKPRAAPVTVAQTPVAPVAVASPAPKPVAAEPLAAKPVAAPAAVAAPVAVRPAPVAKPALAMKPVPASKPVPAIAPTPKLVKAAAPTPSAKLSQALPASVFSLSAVPLHPGLTDFTAETWFAPAIATVRKLALMNAKVLDHACAELKATLAEVEALGRASTPSEAVAVQGKAFSRRIEAGSAYVAELASMVRRTDKAA